MGAVIVFWGPPVNGNYRPTYCVEQFALPPIRASNAVATTMYALGARLSILTGGPPKLFSIQAPPPVKFQWLLASQVRISMSNLRKYGVLEKAERSDYGITILDRANVAE